MSEIIDTLKKNMRVRNRLTKTEIKKKADDTIAMTTKLEKENESIQLLLKTNQQAAVDAAAVDAAAVDGAAVDGAADGAVDGAAVDAAELMISEEEKMEKKLNKWILDEERGEKELIKLLNQHPEDFQNVDKYFFFNKMSNLYQILATKKTVQKLQHKINMKKNTIYKKNKPFIMKLM